MTAKHRRWAAYYIAAVVLVLSVVLLTLSGCSTITEIVNGGSAEDIFSAVEADAFGAGKQVYSTVTVTLPRHSGYLPAEDKYAYGTLKTDDQRRAYAAIEESLFCITNEPGGKNGRYALKRAIIPNLTSGEIFMIKEAVLCDHPEAFWVTGSYTLGHNMHDGNYIVLYSGCDYSTIIDRLKAMELAVSAMLKELPSNLSEFDRELIIHNCLVRDVDYDKQAAESDAAYIDAATSYGALVNKKALCSGYSMAMKLMLNRVGVSCTQVKGISKDVGHMWNLVRIDGAWYHLDVTWDDPLVLSAENVQRFDYFNVTDAKIAIDHVISDNYSKLTEELIEQQNGQGLNFFNFDMELCVSEAACFYELKALELPNLSKSSAEAIAEEMSRMSRSGETALFIKVPSGMDTGVTSDWLDETLVGAMTDSNKKAKDNGGKRIAQCARETKGEGAALWQNVYCVKLIFED